MKPQLFFLHDLLDHLELLLRYTALTSPQARSYECGSHSKRGYSRTPCYLELNPVNLTKLLNIGLSDLVSSQRKNMATVGCSVEAVEKLAGPHVGDKWNGTELSG